MSEKQTLQQKARSHFDAVYESIDKTVRNLDSDDDAVREEAIEEIQSDPLSAERVVGYKIQLAWGGPEYWLEGEVNEYGAPDTVRFYFRDWFTLPELVELSPSQRDTLLTYASQFYFDE